MDFYSTEICSVNHKHHTGRKALHIGEIIRREIDAKGLQKKWVAAQFGTTVQNFSNLLTRYSLTTDQLERLGRILEVDFYAIISQELNKINQEYEVSAPETTTASDGDQDPYSLKILMDKMADLESLVRESLEKQAKGKKKPE